MTKIYISVLFIFSSGCIQIQTRYTKNTPSQFKEAHSKDDQYSSQKENQNSIRLKILENNLKGRDEINQYGRALPYFENIEERIDFLSLPSFKARQIWLNQKKFWQRIQKKNKIYTTIIEAKDIAIGMTPEQVRMAWGEPTEISVSGISAFGNMVWTYSSQIPSPSGYQSQKKFVYFESGTVSGWDLQ